MTKVLLKRSYKGRKPGEILDLPETEANGVQTLGLGEILKEEEQPAPKEKAKKDAAE
jgi:hypothetical protein